MGMGGANLITVPVVIKIRNHFIRPCLCLQRESCLRTHGPLEYVAKIDG